MMEKIGNWIFPLKFGFGIGYGIGRKYRPIWVSVLVSDLNKNSGFGHTLPVPSASRILRLHDRFLSETVQAIPRNSLHLSI